MLLTRKSSSAANTSAKQHDASASPKQQRPVRRDKRIAEVPASRLSSHARWQPAGKWSGVFELAVWLRLPQGTEHPLQLALRYTDQKGEKTILVDICKPGSYKSALLNGSVTIEAQGQVHDMGLFLLGLPNDVPLGLDEWHFVPQVKRQSPR
jgi:hypothetical protein